MHRHQKRLFMEATQKAHCPEVSPGTDDQSGLEGKPTWFLIAEKDLMVSPETQRFTAARMKSKVVFFACGTILLCLKA